jgi:hypothetical protein
VPVALISGPVYFLSDPTINLEDECLSTLITNPPLAEVGGKESGHRSFGEILVGNDA